MDFRSGNFPVGVVIFGLIALFLALRLRSVLGKRTGLDRPGVERTGVERTGVERTGAERPLPRNDLSSRDRAAGPAQTPPDAGRGRRIGPFRNPLARPAADAAPLRPRLAPEPETPTVYVLPEANASAGQALTTLSAILPQFDAPAFLRGAESAFRRIVEAFASGNRAVLRDLLTDEAYGAFEQAIAARETNRETQRSDIRHVAEVALIAATVGQGVDGVKPSFDVRFVSDQVSFVANAAGDAVGGADALTELCDIWTFEGTAAPDAGGSGVTWRLAATRSA